MKRAALLILESAALLVLLEVGIRMAVPVQVDVPHLRVFPQGFYTWYPRSRFTYHNLPKVEPATAEVRINERGLRGASFPRAKPPGERRVLVLGDSYTAAVQLDEALIFTTLLEPDLNAAARPGFRYRVLNAGFNGAGTAHELLYFLHQGRDLDPDVVVLVYAYNDLEDTLAHGGFYWRDGRLELAEELRHPAVWRGLLLALRDAVGNRSLALFLLYKALSGVGRAHAEMRDEEGAADGVTLVQHLIEQLIASAHGVGAPVVVLTIPSPLHLSGGDPAYDRLMAALHVMIDGTTNQLIVGDAPLLEAERAGHPVYLASDGHLSVEGHRAVANVLAPAILRAEGAAQR